MSAVSFLTLLFGLLCASMECRKEQRATIKACASWGYDIRRVINGVRAVWNDHALSHTQIRFWYKRFQDEPDHNTADHKRPGRPRSARVEAKIEQVQQAILDDRHVTVQQLAQDTSVSTATVQKIIKKDLAAKKLAPKFVMTVLTEAQRKSRMDISRTNAQLIDQDRSVLDRVIAVDESWVYTYDPRTKQADLEWTFGQEPRPRKALRSRSQKKIMLILYFDSQGVVLADFVKDATVNSEIYVDSLHCMREAVRRKRPDLWANRNFILLQDNARPHTSEETMDYLHKVGQDLWQHPAYSPDLSPCDFFAFPQLKAHIRGHRFNTLDDVQQAA